MKLILIFMLVVMAGLTSAGDWETVGGNSQHNGLNPDCTGPRDGVVLWEKTTLPSTLGMQVYTWDTLCVVGRYTFSPNRITLACHSMYTGDTVWTRNYTGSGKYLPFGCRDGRLYVRDFKETQHDTLFCIDMLTGDILWQSEHRVGLGIVWSAAFTDSGDLLVPGDNHRIFRINHETGDSVWSCHRVIPTTGGECICVYGDYAFSWKGAIGIPIRMVAIDLATGVIVDSTDGLPGDGDQEMPFSIGLDGTIYAPRDGGDLHALQYTDSGFVELWRAEYGGSVWMQFGVGPDSSVYIPRGRKLFRLDHRTGAALDSSPPLTAADDLVPRIAVDRDGFLFVSTGTYSGGGIRCLTPSLDTVWSDPMSSTYYTGPALGFGGITVVAGPGSTIKAYQPTVGIAGPPPVIRRRPVLRADPNPFRRRTLISCGPAARPGTAADIYDALGRKVRTLVFTAGSAAWDGRDDDDRRVAPGVYVVRVNNHRTAVTVVE